uniref:Tetratricopeptide repeat-containing family protein n=1 Tax=Tetraselmis sp. GSL018 TaxID=582737 RepID=A0A061SH88_9CHLO
MMDPDMAKLAMEQMAKMTPEQMAAMRQQMGGVSPEMMQAAMAQMNSMSEADKARMREQMSRMDPGQLPDMGAATASRMRAQHEYQYKASLELKEEGNALHRQQRFAEAVEKYSRAHANMETHTSQEGRALRKACALNLASCCLKLDRSDEAIRLCTEVLAQDPSNPKALYRRGMARVAAGSLEQGVLDLRKAAGDRTIKDQLSELEARLAAEGRDVPEDASAEEAPASVAGGQEAPWAAASAAPDPSQAAALMKDPGMRKMMINMMKNMTDDELRKMAEMNGAPPGMSVEQIRSQYSMLDSMDEADIERMCDTAATARSARKETGEAEGSSRVPGARPGPDQLSKMHEMMSQDPEAMKQVMDTVSSMPPEQLEAIAKASGLPEGMKLTPELMKMSADMMSKMSFEDIQRMSDNRWDAQQASSGVPAESSQAPLPSARAGEGAALDGGEKARGPSPSGPPEMTPEVAAMASGMMSSRNFGNPDELEKLAGSMYPGGSSSGSSDSSSAPDMERMQREMMSNPEMMKMAQEMMRSMDPKTLAAISKQAGMEMSEEHAKKMTEALKSMKPEQMERLVKFAGYAQKAKNKAAEARDFLLSRKVFWISLAMVVVALALRYMGWM